VRAVYLSIGLDLTDSMRGFQCQELTKGTVSSYWVWDRSWGIPDWQEHVSALLFDHWSALVGFGKANQKREPIKAKGIPIISTAAESMSDPEDSSGYSE